MPSYVLQAILGVVIILLAILLILSLKRIMRMTGMNRRFSLTLSRAYEQVYELDLTNNTFYQYYILNGMLEKTSTHEPLDVYLPRMIGEHIYPKDIEKISELLSREHLQALSEQSQTAYQEYRRLSPQGTAYWCSILVQGLPKKAFLPAIVMIYICNIDETKSKEHMSRKWLMEALKNAEHLSEVKSNFTSRISHEIRTPLNAIIGYLNIAQMHSDDPRRVTDCMEKANLASRQLLAIVNDILDMSAMESGRLKLNKQPFKLRDFISSIGTLYYGQAEASNHSFSISLQDVTEDNLIGDDVRLRQILMNLLNNAFKFTPKDGHVKLTVQQKAIINDVVHLSFVVADDGPGMQEVFLERIFDAYEQEESATVRRHGGSGLGLSIVKNLVDMMGGSIAVQSTYGEGTTFTVNLPISSRPCELPNGTMRRALARIRMLVITRDKGVLEWLASLTSRIGIRCDTAIGAYVGVEKAKAAAKEGLEYDLLMLDWDLCESEGELCLARIRAVLGKSLRVVALADANALSLKARADELGLWTVVQKPLNQSIFFDLLYQAVQVPEDGEVSQPRDPSRLAGLRVLLAEDNLLNREIARELLEHIGLEVDTSENGAEAVEKFTSSPPGTYHLILMDIQMPIMDGFTAAKRIRSSEHAQAQSIPIIALTANAYPGDVNQSLASGMNAHASKPIDPEALYELLDQYLDDAKKS